MSEGRRIDFTVELHEGDPVAPWAIAERIKGYCHQLGVNVTRLWINPPPEAADAVIDEEAHDGH